MLCELNIFSNGFMTSRVSSSWQGRNSFGMNHTKLTSVWMEILLMRSLNNVRFNLSENVWNWKLLWVLVGICSIELEIIERNCSAWNGICISFFRNIHCRPNGYFTMLSIVFSLFDAWNCCLKGFIKHYNAVSWRSFHLRISISNFSCHVGWIFFMFIAEISNRTMTSTDSTQNFSIFHVKNFKFRLN